MPTISITIQKGGSGKTTTAINLAAALQQLGKSVLTIDLDPQANLSQALGVPEEVEPNIHTAFQQVSSGEKVDIKAMIMERSGLEIIPASIDLAGAELELVSVYGREQLLQNMLKPLTKKYDFILIDCPPAIGMLTVNALVASDYILMPLQAEFLPLKGVRSFMKHYATIKNTVNKKLEILGILLTRYDSRKVMNREVLEDLTSDYGELVLKSYIRTNITLAKSQKAGKDIFSFDRASNGAVDYLELGDEILRKLR